MKSKKMGFQEYNNMEFMFGELMTRIEKLEPRSDDGRSKRGREARKEESVAGNSADEVEDDLNRGGGFRTHRGERYENRSRRGHIRPHKDFEHRGDFNDLGDIDRNLCSIKLKIPAFKGKTDLEAYLDWEKKVEMIFDIHRYSEEKKVKLAVVEFTDYAMVWRERLVVERKRNRERPVSTWEELKIIMKKRYVPKHYYRELFNRLQMITQGNKSVEEYQKELEVAMIRANVNEDDEVTMSRFLNGLNRDITNVVELQSYVDLEELVHLAIKVEGQLKRKGNTRSGAYTGSSSGWKMNYRREGSASSKPLVTSKVAEPTFMKKQVSTNDKKLKGKVQPKRNRDIKCFKCQGLGHYASECANHQVMILRDDGEIVSTSEESDCDDMPPLEDASDLEYAVGDKVLVVRRSLSIQTKEEDVEQQRENIFHTRCLINDKVCSMIIDSGSCTNVASVTLVRKLRLNTIKHERPCQLQWLNECGVVRVNRQVMISFLVGKYKDEVLCDVVPMHATHLLLGRPWQFDKKAKHDGFKNRYSLEKDGRIYTLAPLSPKQVYEDQIQLKKGYEEEQHVSAKVEEQKDLAKMEKQVEQHGEDVRKREKKVSHELKTKGNKVSALRTLGEGHGQE